MARGSAVIRDDPDAQSDFRRRHGILNQDIPVGNAQALINAHAASRSQEVEKASLLPMNNQATADLDLNQLSSDLDDDRVLAAAVRGNAIVVIAEDASGRAYKAVLPANDSYEPPEETPEAQEMRKATEAELQLQSEISKLRAEQEEEIAKLRQEQQEQLAEEVEKLRQEFASKAESDDGEETPAKQYVGGTVAQEAENEPAQGGGAKTEKSVGQARPRGK